MLSNNSCTKESILFSYLSEVDDELMNLVDNDFIGNVSFQFNFFKGGVTNVIVDSKKSIKLSFQKES